MAHILNNTVPDSHNTIKTIQLTEAVQQIEKLIDQGRYFEARSKAENELKVSEDLRIKQLFALALSKSGVPEAALEFIEPVYLQFPDDPESAGILGSICKELFKKNQSTPFAIRSRDTYFKNFSATKNFYTGINAASMSAMAGQASRSREIATEVISLLEGNSGDFWALATLGEAFLLTKNKSKAAEYYVQARKLAGKDWGKITSVHNQLWLLNHFVAVPIDILKLFSPPVVVAFVGHMIDQPQRAEQRFPASIESKIKDSILHSIRSLNANIGYCSLACGGDILFAEAMAEEGGEVNIFLPFVKPDFIKTSVQFAGENWVGRFNALLEKFPVTYVTNEPYGGFDDIFSFQSRIIFGSAVLRSSSYHADPFLLTVLSSVDLNRKEGGTRDTLHLWPYPQQHVNINPDIFITNEAGLVAAVAKVASGAEKTTFERPVLYLVHADLSEISSIELQRIERAYNVWNDHPGPKAIFESEGTAVLAAFETEPEAIKFVQLMLDSLKAMRHETSFKISLHAGPVYVGSSANPGSKLSGTAVELVKGLNAITTKGSLFASDHFASLLALNNKVFSIDYAGIFIPQNSEKRTTIYKIGFMQFQ